MRAHIDRHFDKADKILYSAVGLLMALVFILGYIAINASSTASSVKNKEKVKNAAVYAACLEQAPKSEKFVRAFINSYTEQRANSISVLRITPMKSPLYDSRFKTVVNQNIIINTLKGFLPVKCTLQK